MGRNNKRKRNLENRLSAHDYVVHNLKQRLYNNNTKKYISDHHEYSLPNLVGEIDLLSLQYNNVYKGLVAYVFEIKMCNKYQKIKKAKEQLDKATEYLTKTLNVKKIYCFYVHGKYKGGYNIKLINIYSSKDK